MNENETSYLTTYVVEYSSPTERWWEWIVTATSRAEAIRMTYDHFEGQNIRIVDVYPAKEHPYMQEEG